MRFEKFVNWAFLALITGAVVFGVRVLSNLDESVRNLNLTVATMLVKDEYQDKEIKANRDEIKLIKDKLVN
jgi:hypothetical protein